MIKMSEYTPKTNTLMANVLAQGFSKNKVAIVCGEVDIATAFSNLKFDHLFFTGSTNVGRIVMRSAANNLVPVTLELGGKSPSIIDDEIDIDLAVTRLIFGKTLNSGQTCCSRLHSLP
jgi:coniferyl-aldehyde dehydrogenase